MWCLCSVRAKLWPHMLYFCMHHLLQKIRQLYCCFQSLQMEREAINIVQLSYTYTHTHPSRLRWFNHKQWANEQRGNHNTWVSECVKISGCHCIDVCFAMQMFVCERLWDCVQSVCVCSVCLCFEGSHCVQMGSILPSVIIEVWPGFSTALSSIQHAP